MKLQPALIFGEHMVLQRNETIPVWGRSVRDDLITVTLGENTGQTKAVNGLWRIDLPAMSAAESLPMTISSSLTGESINFTDIAIGEVWLAGGQSNMEFLLKYDECAEEMSETEEDTSLRFFRYPTANFVGCLEKEPYSDDGFWRQWNTEENRSMYSATAAFMGRKLRKALGVPVGFIGVNWGGTPAAAWTDLKDIESNPKLKAVLDWYEEGCSKLDLLKYYTASDQPQPEPSPEMKAAMENFMMGIGLEKLFSGEAPPPPPPADYTAYMLGPRGAIRPAGLYDNMLSKVAPYGIRGAVWYQGEDDDFRGWYDFYDESMKTLISSWRKLWNKDFPFLQVELAPFKGRGITGANQYYTMRQKQHAVADSLPDVYNICILDSGDEMNIHVRKKKPVGERLALLARKYVYGETDLLADSPRYIRAEKEGNIIKIEFNHTGDGLVIKGDIQNVLKVFSGEKEITVNATAEGSCLILQSPELEENNQLRIEFAEMNYCQMPLFNSAGLPAFPFTAYL